MRILPLTVSACLVATASGAQAKGLKWMDTGAAGLPAGAKMAVVKGDPGKAGDFVIRIKMPADYAVPPHSHPTDEKVSVKSGSLNYGMGDKADKAAAGKLDAGYHVTLQSGMNHWVFTTAPVELEVAAMGPFAITYANPADDPRKK